MQLSGATIAFDLDGTLVDTAPDLVGALNQILAEHGLEGEPVGSAKALVGRGARALITRGFGRAGRPPSEAEIGPLTDRFIDLYRSRIARESRPFPGLIVALDRLSAEGARLCVCTNKRTALSLDLLDALELTSRFVAVTGADATPAPKPDPRCVLAAIQAAGGDPASAVMVGDSENDVLAAKAAGVPVVAVSFGYTEIPARALGADAVIDSFAELPGAVVSLLAARSRPAA